MQMQMQMQKKKKSDVSRRAWNLLRLALLWARKGGVFKRRLIMMMNLRDLFPNYFLRSSQRASAISHYGERELSFEDTPIIHVKMHRPNSSMRFRMPCISSPQVDFDYDFAFENDDDDDVTSTSYYNDDDDGGGDDEGIDLKAEQFIAKFYEQMKLQRQVSYLQYNTNDRDA